MEVQDYTDIRLATKFLNRLPQKRASNYRRLDLLHAMAWVKARVHHENYVEPGNDALQKSWFQFLMNLANKRGPNSLVRYVFVEWSKRTYNTYGRIYGTAWKTAYAEATRRAHSREVQNHRQAVEKTKVDAIKKVAKRAAKARHQSDPKQQEKQLVLDCWKQWQGSPGLYKSAAAFARDMLEKCEHLESEATIARWVREWRQK